jgi:hypothetical protein
LSLLAFLPVSALFAQDELPSKRHNLKIGIEFGMNILSCELVKPEQIRANHYSHYHYTDDFFDYGLWKDYTNMWTLNFGVKPEYFVFNNRIGISSGLRFTYVKTELISDRNDFLWKLREEGLHTYYIQIKDIRQDNYLLSVPLEVRFFPNKRELPFQHYFKLGASFNYRINNDTKVNFAKQNLNNYNDVVKNQLPDIHNAFSYIVFFGTGFKIGRFKEGRMIPWGNFEIQIPFMLTNNSFAFAGKYGFGAGLQISFQVPIGANAPIGSK